MFPETADICTPLDNHAPVVSPFYGGVYGEGGSRNVLVGHNMQWRDLLIDPHSRCTTGLCGVLRGLGSILCSLRKVATCVLSLHSAACRDRSDRVEQG